jgi:Mce-associated membrane protein
VAGLNRRSTAAAEEAPEAAVAPEAVEAPEVAGSEAVEAPQTTEEAQESGSGEDAPKAAEAVDWKPSAAPKPRSKPTPQPQPSTSSEAEAEVAEPVAARAGSAADDWVLPVSLLVVALLFAGLGTFFLVKSRSVTYDAALVDAATTSAVNGQVREAVEKSFSYNFADVTATEKAAKELLTGKALCQYNAVFGPVREIAPQQKLVVTVRVVSSAVSSLRDGRATVLVFADQVTTRTTDNSSGGGTAMLQVGAVDDGGRWKIDNLKMFGATADQDRQLQGC